MALYVIKPGHKLIVSDPDQPGISLEKLAGATVDLSEEDAAQYLDAIELVPVAVAAPASLSDHPSADQV